MSKSKWIAVAVTGAFAALLLAIPALGQATRDSNSDRLPDRWENTHHLSLSVNQAPRDQDQDGLKNMGEYKNNTDPRDPDSDANGTKDGPQCQGHEGQGGPHHPPPPGDDDSGSTTPPVAP
jgi:hypothetical protein